MVKNTSTYAVLKFRQELEKIDRRMAHLNMGHSGEHFKQKRELFIEIANDLAKDGDAATLTRIFHILDQDFTRAMARQNMKDSRLETELRRSLNEIYKQFATEAAKNVSLSEENKCKNCGLERWAGGEVVTLAIVFTDIVGSTKMREETGDETMNEIQRNHFNEGRKFIKNHRGWEIKTIGDSFMVAFKSTEQALDFAQDFYKNTGHPSIKIRVGIHIGPLKVEQNDVSGNTANFAHRVIEAIEGAEIWASERAKNDIDDMRAVRHSEVAWQRHDGIKMKGFTGLYTLWSINDGKARLNL